MKSLMKKTSVFLVLLVSIVGLSGNQFSATEVSTENNQQQEITAISMPQIEMQGQNFTISSEEAKKLTVEVAIDQTHANVTFPNQMAMINLLALVEANPKELAEINKGVAGEYPLTLSVEFNGELLETKVMVTVEETSGMNSVLIYTIAVALAIAAIVIATNRKNKTTK